jgi:hypothetical protein
MAIRTELSFRLQNSPGAFARVNQLLDQEHLNILALTLEAGGVLRLIVDNPLHAAGILREHQYRVEEHEVLYVSLPNDPGALAAVARMLASASINVEYAYASAVEGHGMAAAVVGVADAPRASAAAGL